VSPREDGPGTFAGRTYATIEHDGVTDQVAVEEPLEIRVDGRPLTVTMRTPGHDEELALGFLYGEGLIAEPRPVGPPADLAANAVEVQGPLLGDPGERRFYATSSCGVCGKASLDDIAVRCDVVPPGFTVAADVLVSLPERLREAQRVFDRTGGLHAAGLFDGDGSALSVREDVGRHNAVDKVIGEQLLAGPVPMRDRVLQVSGRASFEIVQKAAVAGIPVVSAVSAPSSLAVDAGGRLGVTVVGFVRDSRCNVYTHPDRIV
jgi:FdhD protein